jgi:NAD(P)-dependent dehydrogenase (short-subunit alcohol dehydrogenase family)
MQLQGKTALVTGATSGIGEAIAHAFAHEGAQVVVSGRDAQRGLAVAQAIGQQSRFCVVADLTSSTDIARLISETRKLVGSIDILVNNAGIFPIDETARIDAATFDAVIATNVKALFFLTAAFDRTWLSAGRERSLISLRCWRTKGFREERCTARRKQRWHC